MSEVELTERDNKRVFGWLEVGFDSLYLLIALGKGIFLLLQPSSNLQKLASIIVFILAVGDSFHLVPRIMAVTSGNTTRYSRAMGWGKLVSSISVTLFYLFLWQFGHACYGTIPGIIESTSVYLLTLIRLILCMFPQNRWLSETPPLDWAILRNVPFIVLGALVCVFYFSRRLLVPSLSYMWLAILLSFAFYVPVVLFVARNRKLGMLMLPKTGMYIWILLMLLNGVR